LFPLVVAVLVLETSFFSAVAPLLPEYSAEHELSKAEAGVLAAAYPAGTFAAAVPSGWLAVRWGVKPTLLLSLTVMGLASVAFGFASHIVLLDLARFMQGVGGAGLWAAGMAWLVAASSPERRGEMIGLALGAGIVGLLLGPALGGLASATSPELVFGSVAVVAAALGAWAVRIPGLRPDYEGGIRDIAIGLKRPAVLTGFWFFMLPAIFAGIIEVLEPLRLAESGASGPLIAAVFVVAAGIETILSPAAGWLSDRRGRLALLRAGLAAAAVMSVVLPTPNATVLIGASVVLAFAALGICWAPGMAMLSDASLAARLPLAMPFAIANLAWAAGHTVGSAGGAALGEAASDVLPYALIGGLCLATFLGSLRLREQAVV
jgi:MFS family permease